MVKNIAARNKQYLTAVINLNVIQALQIIKASISSNYLLVVLKHT